MAPNSPIVLACHTAAVHNPVHQSVPSLETYSRPPNSPHLIPYVQSQLFLSLCICQHSGAFLNSLSLLPHHQHRSSGFWSTRLRCSAVAACPESSWEKCPASSFLTFASPFRSFPPGGVGTGVFVPRGLVSTHRRPPRPLRGLSHKMGETGPSEVIRSCPLSPSLCCEPGRSVGLLVSLDSLMRRRPPDGESVISAV